MASRTACTRWRPATAAPCSISALDGLLRVSNVLAGIKFVVAIAFVAYLIEFARALVVRREPNRETLDAVLLLASVAIVLWAWPALGSGDAA